MHLQRVASRFNIATWKRDQDASHSLEEHHQLVELLRKRDTEQTKKAMLEHIENARQRVMGSVQYSAFND